jgi:hypothetical protein
MSFQRSNNFISAASIRLIWADVSIQASKPYKILGALMFYKVLLLFQAWLFGLELFSLNS